MRLIDADKVIEVIKEMQNAYPIDDQRPHARGIRVALFDCRNLIENQPTAYDADKVVEEISNIEIGGDCRHKCEHYDWSVGACQGICEDYVRNCAIDIVEKGGVDDI